MRNIKKSFPPGQRRARWLKHELNCHWNMSIECGGVKIKTDIDMRNLFYLSLGSTAKAQWTGKGRKVAFGFTWRSNFFCCVVFMLAGCLIEPCTVVSVVSFAVLSDSQGCKWKFYYIFPSTVVYNQKLQFGKQGSARGVRRSAFPFVCTICEESFLLSCGFLRMNAPAFVYAVPPYM